MKRRLKRALKNLEGKKDKRAEKQLKGVTTNIPKTQSEDDPAVERKEYKFPKSPAMKEAFRIARERQHG